MAGKGGFGAAMKAANNAWGMGTGPGFDGICYIGPKNLIDNRDHTIRITSINTGVYDFTVADVCYVKLTASTSDWVEYEIRFNNGNAFFATLRTQDPKSTPTEFKFNMGWMNFKWWLKDKMYIRTSATNELHSEAACSVIPTPAMNLDLDTNQQERNEMPIARQLNEDVQNWSSIFELETNASGYTIKKYIGQSKDVYIPVTIGNTDVTTIGNEAFYGCRFVQTFVLPNSITCIGNKAFEFCSGLTSIALPCELLSIGSFAFSGCSNLASIIIPKNVTKIGNWAFKSCVGLLSIAVDAENSCYSSVDNCLIETETHTLVFGCRTSKIPNGITTIGKNAFYGCHGLKEISIPKSVLLIESEAFEFCSRLSSIIYSGTKAEWDGISKKNDWDSGTANYVVHCTECDITKSV